MEEEKPMSDVRLIERWLPIAEVGLESVRERTPMTPFPAPNRLHVWWARRPLVASRAAILASLLPESADHASFLHALGIHGDAARARRLIETAKRTGDRVSDPYGYERAFKFSPTESAEKLFGKNSKEMSSIVVLDPTAGGGSIPFEASRMGMSVLANDLNPVAGAILKATLDYPARIGSEVEAHYDQISAEFRRRFDPKVSWMYPQEDAPDQYNVTYLWARTVTCPYCSGVVPLSPNWQLSNDGVGVKLKPTQVGGSARECHFEIVERLTDQSPGSVSGGDATCPFSDCTRVIDGDEVKRQAQSGEMRDQLFAVAYQRNIEKRLKSGKLGRPTKQRGFRAPLVSDVSLAKRFEQVLSEKLPEWEALNIVPVEAVPEGSKTDEAIRYGIAHWREMYSPRQLLCHGFASETFREIVEEDRAAGSLTDARRASYVYLAFALSKLLNWNARLSSWNVRAGTLRSVFDRHDFAFKWSYGEMDALAEGLGYDWAIRETRKCLSELIELTRSTDMKGGPLFSKPHDLAAKTTTISLKSGAALDHVADGSVDAVVMDPPYGANVMYAELSDFFYVWLKRTAGLVLPELFTQRLTDKQAEAVANRASFAGQKGADALANRDYQEKMAAIFAECRRVLKPNGIMTVMFTHKDTSAWDALTKGLIEAGFIITASWPVNTEAEGSLHIKDKAAANSTIFLVCRPRPADQGDETTYWEDVEPLVAKAVRTRVEEFQKAGIGGVDLYLASFGPALEEFSRHWPLKRGTPRPEPLAKKRRKQAELFEEEFDPYAVTPEDALDAARREVKTWRLNQLTHTKGRGDLDATTSWFVLAWDAFKAPVFSYDEGLRLARAVGADLEGQLIGKICEKKGSDIKLWDSATRAAKSGLGPADGSRAMIDAIHHAAHRGRTRTLDAALDLLKDAGIDNDPQFLAALEAVLEVLPPSRNFVGFDVATGDAKSAADDFDALEKLRRLAFSDRVDEPLQLSLFAEEAA